MTVGFCWFLLVSDGDCLEVEEEFNRLSSLMDTNLGKPPNTKPGISFCGWGGFLGVAGVSTPTRANVCRVITRLLKGCQGVIRKPLGVARGTEKPQLPNSKHQEPKTHFKTPNPRRGALKLRVEDSNKSLEDKTVGFVDLFSSERGSVFAHALHFKPFAITNCLHGYLVLSLPSTNVFQDGTRFSNTHFSILTQLVPTRSHAYFCHRLIFFAALSIRSALLATRASTHSK